MTDDESSSSRWWRSKTHLAIFYLLHKKLIDRKRCRFSFDRPTEHNIKQHLKLWPTPVSAIMMNADFWGFVAAVVLLFLPVTVNQKGYLTAKQVQKKSKKEHKTKEAVRIFKKSWWWISIIPYRLLDGDTGRHLYSWYFSPCDISHFSKVITGSSDSAGYPSNENDESRHVFNQELNKRGLDHNNSSR